MRSVRFIMGANVFMIACKLAVVLLTGSVAVLAVLVDSLFDFLGSIFAYVGVKKAEEPPDLDHLYGHKKYGALASIMQLALIATTAALLIMEAAKKLQAPEPLSLTIWDFVLMAIVISVDIAIVYYIRKNANAQNIAIAAALGNYTSDILQNSLVLISLFATWGGFYAADPLAGIFVALFMLRVVKEVGGGALSELTDASPPRKKLEEYGKAVLRIKGVKHFHRMRARSSGGEVNIDLHLQLDPKTSLKRAHAVCGLVKFNLKKKFPEITEVLVHAEPYDKSSARAPKFGS